MLFWLLRQSKVNLHGSPQGTCSSRYHEYHNAFILSLLSRYYGLYLGYIVIIIMIWLCLFGSDCHYHHDIVLLVGSYCHYHHDTIGAHRRNLLIPSYFCFLRGFFPGGGQHLRDTRQRKWLWSLSWASAAENQTMSPNSKNTGGYTLFQTPLI